MVEIAGRFELGPLIGGGATGSVYAGVDRLTGEKVAIKALRTEFSAGMPELVERFRREGELLRRLNHPNIVKILATVPAGQTGEESEGSTQYIVMEYVGGGSLADLLRQEPRLPVARVVSIALELSDALSRAHHLEILHRDIKPSNILLAEDGAPRLSDFGLARLAGASRLTSSGSILGTFAYLSPEAYYQQELDGRSDLWSFGVVLYEMLTGQLPFTGDSPQEILRAINVQPLPDPSWRRKDIPPALAELVRRMLMRDVAIRIASARLAGAELESIQKSLKRTLETTAGVEAAPLHDPTQDIHGYAQDRTGGGQAASPSPAGALEPAPPSAAPSKIRVLVVDDHAVVRQGLRTFIDLQEDMAVTGEGSNGVEAVELAGRLQPDVVLLDLVMPQMDGVEATRRIKSCSPNSRVVILTSFGEDDQVFPAIRAGAQGYLLKDIHPAELVRAVREVHQGKAQLHPDIAGKLMSAVAAAQEDPADARGFAAPRVERSSEAGVETQRGSGSPEDELTSREQEVLRWLARGLSNREIAGRMVISETTVKTHVSNLLGKLGLEDRTQAAIWAIKHGLEAGE